MAKVAFLGLGVMGYPMAGHLKSKGAHEVTVYNRTSAKAEKWVGKHRGGVDRTRGQAAEGQDFVMTCVGNDDDLREVTLGPNGAFAGVKKGAVFVDHTTASAGIARELYAEASKRGFDFIDAPVSGGQAGAENGTLTVMCGGDAAPYGPAEGIIMAHARMRGLLARPDGGSDGLPQRRGCPPAITSDFFSPHGEERGQRPRMLRLSKDEPWLHMRRCPTASFETAGKSRPPQDEEGSRSEAAEKPADLAAKLEGILH